MLTGHEFFPYQPNRPRRRWEDWQPRLWAAVVFLTLALAAVIAVAIGGGL